MIVWKTDGLARNQLRIEHRSAHSINFRSKQVPSLQCSLLVVRSDALLGWEKSNVEHLQDTIINETGLRKTVAAYQNMPQTKYRSA
jgi:hypothetical protein